MMDKERSPVRVKAHEKERQFLDALKIIVQSSYTISESDFSQILTFLKVEDIAGTASHKQI